MSPQRLLVITIFIVASAGLAFYLYPVSPPPSQWTEKQILTLQSLWLESLTDSPNDASNRVANNETAAEFGQLLFFDPRLSSNKTVSCATCHQPEHRFTDKRSIAVGVQLGDHNTQSIVGSAYSPWLFWDGRKDSLWSQALAPLENAKEHNSSRTEIAELITSDQHYHKLYKKIFGVLPDISTTNGATEVFVNVGKAIAAYERKLYPGSSRFDNYVDFLLNQTNHRTEELLSADEISGLALFIGKAQCINCHNGPLFTNFAFHNNGLLPPPGKIPAFGRVRATKAVLQDEFNCLSSYSDDETRNCSELQFIKQNDENIGAFKTPSLRNLRDTEPYMHAGQVPDLLSVLRHYNKAELALIGHNEAKPLNLSTKEIQQLEKFLQSLQAPINADPRWLQAPSVGAGADHSANVD